MIKKRKVFNFKIWLESKNATCDVWKGSGWIKGEFFIVDFLCNGYSKAEIAKTLKARIRVAYGQKFGWLGN